MATRALKTVEQVLDEKDAERVASNVHYRLSNARQQFHELELKKSGHNKFAGYDYFELGDFLIPALRVFRQCGLSAVITFEPDLATMNIVNLDDPTDRIILTSPMGSAALKGCHEVQNIGAVETYQRRYLWVAALEIVEHDALDSSIGAPDNSKTRNSDMISPADVKLIETLAPKADRTIQQICEGYNVSELSELTAEKAAAAIKRLQQLTKEPA